MASAGPESIFAAARRRAQEYQATWQNPEFQDLVKKANAEQFINQYNARIPQTRVLQKDLHIAIKSLREFLLKTAETYIAIKALSPAILPQVRQHLFDINRILCQIEALEGKPSPAVDIEATAKRLLDALVDNFNDIELQQPRLENFKDTINSLDYDIKLYHQIEQRLQNSKLDKLEAFSNEEMATFTSKADANFKYLDKIKDKRITLSSSMLVREFQDRNNLILRLENPAPVVVYSEVHGRGSLRSQAQRLSIESSSPAMNLPAKNQPPI